MGACISESSNTTPRTAEPKPQEPDPPAASSRGNSRDSPSPSPSPPSPSPSPPPSPVSSAAGDLLTTADVAVARMRYYSADVGVGLSARTYVSSRYRTTTFELEDDDADGDGEDDDREEEEEEALFYEGRPAPLIVDVVVDPTQYAMKPIDCWAGDEDGEHRRLVRGVHRGVAPLANLMLDDWDAACLRFGSVRVLHRRDLVNIQPTDASAGSFGTVFEAELADELGNRLFIKGQPLDKQFAYELATLIYAYNQGVPIPAVRGVYRHGDRVFVVQAKSTGVAASSFFNPASASSSMPQVVKFLLLAAWELAIAHRKGIIHCDVALRNFLVGAGALDGVQMIDFGLATVLDDEGDTQNAPYLHDSVALTQFPATALRQGGRMRVSRETDVHQFGWMLVALLEHPDDQVDGRSFLERVIHPLIPGPGAGRGAWTALFEAIDTQRPKRPRDDCPESMWELALRCLHPDAAQRPTMLGIAAAMESIYTSLGDEALAGLSSCSSVTEAVKMALARKSRTAVIILLSSAGTHFLDLNRSEMDADQAGIIASVVESPSCALQTINLDSNNIGPDGAALLADSLKHNTSVQHLNIRSSSIGDEGFASLGRAMATNTTLKSINAYKNGITADGMALFCASLASNRSTSLQSLDLQANDVDDDGAIALGAILRENSSLTFLDLWKNSIGEAGVKAIGEAIASNRKCRLATLILRSNCFGEGGAIAIAKGLEISSTLEVLDLRSNPIGDVGAQALATAIQRASEAARIRLTRLDVRAGGLTSVAAEAFGAALAVNSTIETFIIRSNSLSEQGGVALAAALRGQPRSRLQHLHLQNCDLGDGGISALAAALTANERQTELVELHLRGNKIGPTGARALAEAMTTQPSLQVLDLTNNDLDEPSLEALIGALAAFTSLRQLIVENNSRISAAFKDAIHDERVVFYVWNT